jgi:hypothetical protein
MHSFEKEVDRRGQSLGHPCRADFTAETIANEQEETSSEMFHRIQTRNRLRILSVIKEKSREVDQKKPDARELSGNFAPKSILPSFLLWRKH